MMQEELSQVAQRYGVSYGAIETLWRALQRGGGRLAQFDHPELGGMGQWMPGMVMVSDMFNQALKARVDSLCTELMQLMTKEANATARRTPQTDVPGPIPMTMPGLTWNNLARWWPEHLGTPSSTGGQNDLQYAYFPTTNRLAIKWRGTMTLYDTTGYNINSVSQQQQQGHSIVVFSSTQQPGSIAVTNLKIIATFED
ncbi:MAG: SHOCT domain-containing protein [Chloroflexota bacterium]|nr:SHOCT domain-containing protein [Chloroflexota bacterium]